jgi:retron-type reverse transcriptase
VKRRGGLWPEVVSFPNLLLAFHKAARAKRDHPNVARFRFHLERELCRLQDELQNRTYEPGPYFTFRIFEPKERLISAAPFRDRVVHHALCNVLGPVLEATFSDDTFACRKGKGTHAAVDRFTYFARRHRHVLHGDVRKYFPSIDHQVLKDRLARLVKDRDVLWLADRIIDHSNAQEAVQEWYPGDDLFTPAARRVGLPLGNQTSQLFANLYLSPLDHFVKETLRVSGYLRYMDDFVLFADDAGYLAEARERCNAFLTGLRLRLHPCKSAVSRVCDGTRFLGYCVFPDYRRLPRANVVRMRRRLERLRAARAAGQLTRADMVKSVAGWLGHAGHADTWRLRRRLLRGMFFYRRG